MEETSLRIIQISDIHLFADPGDALLGVKTQESFQAVVDFLASEKKPIDLIILSGDLSQDGSHAAYTRITEILKVFTVPIYWIPGNHDNVPVLEQVYARGPISNDRYIMLKNWQIILLDSQKPHAVEGFLAKSQLDFLEQRLQAFPELHAIVVFHHQPVVVGSKWLDKLGLKNSDELWQIVAPYSQLKTIFFGHVHQEFEKLVNGISCYGTPSTCFQFMDNQENFALANLPPGYRWIQLFDNGRIKTGVQRIARYIGKFEANAKGY